MTEEQYLKLREADKGLVVTRVMVEALDCFKPGQRRTKNKLLKALANPEAGKTKEVVEDYRNLRDSIKGILSERVKWDAEMTQKAIADAYEDFKKSEAFEEFARDAGIPSQKKKGFFSRIFGR